MTNAQLIEELQKLDPEKEVKIQYTDTQGWHSCTMEGDIVFVSVDEESGKTVLYTDAEMV